MFKSYMTLLMLVLISVGQVSAQQLSRKEKRIVQTVEKNNDQAIAFLEEVVNINSGTLNKNGVKEVGKVFADAFEEIGFYSRWIPMPEEMNRAGHMFAEI